jgi:transposase
MRFDLSEEDWVLLEPLLPKSRKSARADDRKIMNAIFYVLRTGMPWRDLPARYGPYTTAYNRFNVGLEGDLEAGLQLASKSRDSLYLIDSTIVKAHRAASGGKGGRKIRRSVSVGAAEFTKIHAIVDSKGRPLSFTVTGGQVHDSQGRRDTEYTSIAAVSRQTRPTTAKKCASRSGTKAPCRSYRTAALPPRKPIAPSASIGGGTKSKTSSAASRIGGV